MHFVGLVSSPTALSVVDCCRGWHDDDEDDEDEITAKMTSFVNTDKPKLEETKESVTQRRKKEIF